MNEVYLFPNGVTKDCRFDLQILLLRHLFRTLLILLLTH